MATKEIIEQVAERVMAKGDPTIRNWSNVPMDVRVHAVASTAAVIEEYEKLLAEAQG